MPFNFEETVDSIESVPTEYRAAYVQGQDGKFTLQDTFKPFASAIIGTNASLGKTTADLRKANKEAADRRGLLKHFEDLAQSMGVEFDEQKPLQDALKAYIEDLAAKAKNGGEVKVNLDKIRGDYERKYGELDTTSKATIGKMEKTLQKYLVGQQVSAALAKHKGSIELLSPVIERSVKVLVDGEDYVVRVVDSNGDARSDGKGGWLGVEDFVGELKRLPAYARAFESEAAGGSGSRPQGSQRGAAAAVTTGKPNMSATEKIAAGLNKGQAQRGGRAA